MCDEMEFYSEDETLADLEAEAVELLLDEELVPDFGADEEVFFETESERPIGFSEEDLLEEVDLTCSDEEEFDLEAAEFELANLEERALFGELSPELSEEEIDLGVAELELAGMGSASPVEDVGFCTCSDKQSDIDEMLGVDTPLYW